MADEFNEFFASIGQNTVKKIEKMAADENYDLNENPVLVYCRTVATHCRIPGL